MHKLFIYIDESPYDVTKDIPKTIHEIMKGAKQVIITPIQLEPNDELAYDIYITTL